MINDRDTVAMGSRAQKVKDPATSGMVNGAKSNKTNSILSKAGAVFCAIFLSPVYQTLLAGIATAGIIFTGGLK